MRHLPLSPLYDTLAEYLKSVEPLLPDEQFTATEKVVQEFADGIGQTLQKKLQRRAVLYPNWLSDWWMNVYLTYRESVVVNLSPALYMPAQNFNNDNLKWCQYTARVIRAALLFKVEIERNKKDEAKRWDDQYDHIYSTCRIPNNGVDKIESYPESRHIVVAYKNGFYELAVYKNDNSAEILTENQLTTQLKLVIANQEVKVAIGLLTTWDRENWANSHKTLVQDAVNAGHFERIKKSIFVVCMDSVASNFNLNVPSMID